MDWASMIHGIAARAAEANTPEPGDYTDDDGFLRCGRCGGKKTTLFTVPSMGIREIVHCTCPCTMAEIERQRQAAETEKRRSDLMAKAFVQDEQWNWTFASARDLPVVRMARNYCNAFQTWLADGEGMVLFGDLGVGKSYAAACIVNELINLGYSARMATLTDIANNAPNGPRGEYISGYTDCDLLVIDDYKAERGTEYMDELAFTIVDKRTTGKRPLIITTNMDRRALENPMTEQDKRIMSRIRQRCAFVPCTGDDQRRPEHSKLIGVLIGGG